MKKLLLSLILLSFAFYFYSCSDSDNPTDPINNTIDERLEHLYVNPPNIGNCDEGVLVMSEKLKAMDRLNYFRNIHGLPEVTYNPDLDVDVQKSALISAANETLNHFPPTSYKCYSPKGDTACQQSNLHISMSKPFKTPWNSAMSIDGWISEEHSASIGHRRWFLSPFLKTVSFGRVDHINNNDEYWVATTMHVFDVLGSTTTDVEFVACPFHDYPITAFPITTAEDDLILSFTVIADKSSQFSSKNKNIDFSSASIQVTDDDGKNYSVSNVSFDNLGYGVANNIEWNVPEIASNTKYNVLISNVNVNGTNKNYTYWFSIND